MGIIGRAGRSKIVYANLSLVLNSDTKPFIVSPFIPSGNTN